MRPLRYSLAAALCALTIPAAADAATIIKNGGGAITVNDFPATSAPYPSVLKVTGADGPTTQVQVLVGVTHDNIGDLDLVLVGPSGAASILMSDACGTGHLTRTFAFFDTAAAPLSQNGPCPDSNVKPSNYEAGVDNFPSPGPGDVFTTSLTTFNGTSANGDWKLFARDDSGFQAGAITGWSLGIETSTSQIVIPALSATSGTANPYPSQKVFGTAAGQVIEDVNLSVIGFNHSFPADVDMMLQGPTGETVMVMSDACSDTDIAANFNYLFDDEATVQLSDGAFTNCSPGSVKPSDFGDPPENMPAPAPARPYGASMSVFDGQPGGAFRLWVNDDAGGDTGYIDTWTLAMTTRPPATIGFASVAIPTAEGETARATVIRTGSANLGAATVNLSVADGTTDAADFSHAVPASLQFAHGEASKTIDIPITADFEGEEGEAFSLRLANASGDAALSDLNSSSTVTIAKSEPDNRFTVGKPVKKRNGSATIAVTVPGPGQLTSDDAGNKDLLRRTEASAAQAGTTTLEIRPVGKAKRKLRRGKKVKLTAEIVYTPDDGTANSAEARVKLKKKRR